MEHNPSSIKIFYTKEYDRFKMINGNRQLDERKITRILKDIEKGLDVLRYCPVLVKQEAGRLHIIDGQHRFYVSRKLKCGVWYIIAEDLSLLDIAKINSNTEKWKDKDFINCYVQLGNKNYEQLQGFMDKFGFPIGVSIVMLTRGYLVGEGGGTTGLKDAFRSGNFEVKNLEVANDLAEKVLLFKKWSFHTSGGFIEAVCRIIRGGKVKITVVQEKCLKHSEQMIPCKTAKQYLAMMETVYNNNTRLRQVIY